LQQRLSQFKDTGLFLSPTTEKFHESIEKATKLSGVIYNSRKLKEVQKNIIESIDHILNYDLVCKHPATANFVGMVERNMQEIKEDFNKVVLSIFGSNIGKDNEVCFPSYKNKKKTQVCGITIQGYCWIVKENEFIEFVLNWFLRGLWLNYMNT
jgi:hypothetical protein